jgi:hypothetical protein
LIAAGSVDRADVTDAIDEQNRTGERLGQILLAREKLGPSGLALGLATLFNMQVVDLSTMVPDSAAVATLPEALVRRLQALPLRWEERTLVIAVSDPGNLTALDDLRAASGNDVRFVVARTDQLEQAIDASWQVHVTPMSSWSARSVMPKPHRSRPRQPSPVTWCCRRSTPMTQHRHRSVWSRWDYSRTSSHLRWTAFWRSGSHADCAHNVESSTYRRRRNWLRLAGSVLG